MVRLDPWVCPLGALMLLVLPLRWLLAAVTAAAFHELCHLGTIRILGGRVHRIQIGITGAVMETEINGKSREFLAAMAGPAGSLSLLLLGRFFPRLAVCGLLQGLLNLLPLYPLDGGRMLRCGLEGLLSKEKIRILEGILVVMGAAAVLRWSSLLATALVIRLFLGKIPCKERRIGVQ